MNFDGFQKALAEFQGRCSTLLGSLTRLQPNRARPPWARIAQPWGGRPMAMTVEAIEERLEGIPVYALSNASEEFLLVSGSSSGKNLGLFCFNKDDAEALLNQVTLIDPHARQGSKVVPVALNKVFQLKVNGVAFRLIPEFSQVKNALQVSRFFIITIIKCQIYSWIRSNHALRLCVLLYRNLKPCTHLNPTKTLRGVW